MALFDWITNSVTLDGEKFSIDSENPLHVLLAETAHQYDMATEQMEDAARSLAKAATRIADSAEESVSPMAGLGYQQMADQITQAQGKREALNMTLIVVLNRIKKEQVAA